MLRGKLALALAAASLLGSVGRSADSGDDRSPATPYYPLQVGTTWHYKTGSGKFTIRVAGRDTVDGQSCARLEMTQDGKLRSIEHVYTTREGVFRQDIQGPEPNKQDLGPVQTLRPAVQLLPIPAKEGASWTVDSRSSSTSSDSTFKAKLKIAAEKVEVPAGSYETLRVSSQDLEAAGNKLTLTSYYAKNVGLVKQVFEVDQTRMVVELEKFEPGK